MAIFGSFDRSAKLDLDATDIAATVQSGVVTLAVFRARHRISHRRSQTIRLWLVGYALIFGWILVALAGRLQRR